MRSSNLYSRLCSKKIEILISTTLIFRMFKFYHEEVLQSHQQIYICPAYAILEFVDDSVTKARFDSLFPVIQDICLHNT